MPQYNNFNFKGISAPYVGGLSDTVKNVSDELKAVYDENEANQLKNEILFANLNVLPGDTEIKTNLRRDLEGISKSFARDVTDNKVAYEMASSGIKRYAQKLLTDEPILAARKSYENYINSKAIADEITAKGGNPLWFQDYKTHKTLTPKEGEYNIYQGVPETQLDYEASAAQYYDNLKASGFERDINDLVLMNDKDFGNFLKTGKVAISSMGVSNTGARAQQVLDQFINDDLAGNQLYRKKTTLEGKTDFQAKKEILGLLKNVGKEYEFNVSKNISTETLKQLRNSGGGKGLDLSGWRAETIPKEHINPKDEIINAQSYPIINDLPRELKDLVDTEDYKKGKLSSEKLIQQAKQNIQQQLGYDIEQATTKEQQESIRQAAMSKMFGLDKYKETIDKLGNQIKASASSPSKQGIAYLSPGEEKIRNERENYIDANIYSRPVLDMNTKELLTPDEIKDNLYNDKGKKNFSYLGIMSVDNPYYKASGNNQFTQPEVLRSGDNYYLLGDSEPNVIYNPAQSYKDAENILSESRRQGRFSNNQFIQGVEIPYKGLGLTLNPDNTVTVKANDGSSVTIPYQDAIAKLAIYQ